MRMSYYSRSHVFKNLEKNLPLSLMHNSGLEIKLGEIMLRMNKMYAFL